MMKLHEQLAEKWQQKRLTIPTISRDLKKSVQSILITAPQIVKSDAVKKQQGPRKYFLPASSFCNYKKKWMTMTYCHCGNTICDGRQKKRDQIVNLFVIYWFFLINYTLLSCTLLLSVL